jgi:hypothetical protein
LDAVQNYAKALTATGGVPGAIKALDLMNGNDDRVPGEKVLALLQIAHVTHASLPLLQE